MTANGFRTATARTGREALEQLPDLKPDLVLLDLLLPDSTGAAIYLGLRHRLRDPIFIVSGRTDESSVVELLEMGADDYICKPFRPRELITRIRSVLNKRQPDATAASTVQLGDIKIDRQRLRVTKGDQLVHLTQMEFKLLCCLAEQANVVVKVEELQEALWGPHHGDYVQACRVHMGNLRKKLRSSGDRKEFIQTVPGVGYILEQSSR